MTRYAFASLPADRRGAHAEPITPRSLRARTLHATLREHGFANGGDIGEVLHLRGIRDWPRGDVLIAVADLIGDGALRIYPRRDCAVHVYLDEATA